MGVNYTLSDGYTTLLQVLFVCVCEILICMLSRNGLGNQTLPPNHPQYEAMRTRLLYILQNAAECEGMCNDSLFPAHSNPVDMPSRGHSEDGDSGIARSGMHTFRKFYKVRTSLMQSCHNVNVPVNSPFLFSSISEQFIGHSPTLTWFLLQQWLCQQLPAAMAP